MITITREEFEGLVADAIDAIPADLGALMENVAVMIDDTSPPGRLWGLYEGIPLTKRGNFYSGAMPDRITVYMAAICRSCETRAEIVDLVRKVVIHEVGHHFGIGDERLKELGWA